MARIVFYSFHYANDYWRTQQIRNIGFIEGNKPASANDWEAVKKGGDAAIENWISNQLNGKSCTVVLVGAETANRKWVIHEIIKSWNLGKGVVGIRIHNLKGSDSNQSLPGPNPFDKVTVGETPLSSIVKLHRPTSSVSTEAYQAISKKITDWIEEAIEIRDGYSGK
jgi:hypothetical protein